MRLNFSPATYKLGAMVLLGALLPVLGMGAASAQTRTFSAPVIAPVPAVPPGFDITGFIQDATLDTSGAICNPANPRLAGGTVTLNGQKVIVPCNTVLQLPAATMPWADLFRTSTGLAPADIAPAGQTGLALADMIGTTTGASIALATPGLLTMKTRSDVSATLQTRTSASLPSYEIRIVGNVVSGRYIAGLVFVSQQSLNASQGVISCIDYTSGEMHCISPLV